MNKTLALLAVCGSLSVPAAAWAQGVAYDPYEGYNRFMFGVNDAVDRAVLAPVARGYRAVTPQPVRSGIGNFFNNLRDLVSAGNNLLRLDIAKAGTDLVRFGLNSTFGFGGLIDIAGAAQMPNHKTSLGDTFATWGWKNSNYFVYPLLGPSTVRDAVGTTVSSLYPVEGAVFTHAPTRWTAIGLKTVDTRAKLLELTDGVEQAAIDRYAYVRDAFMAARARQIGTELPGSDDYVPTFEEEGAAEPFSADNPADGSVTEADAAPKAPADAEVPEQAAAETAAALRSASPRSDIAIRDLPPNTLHITVLPAE
ncbi:MAG: VacJ family lipoprotein [Eikenella sp.]|nr:VacJ family lipoprotein [Eikenella sp.]